MHLDALYQEQKCYNEHAGSWNPDATCATVQMYMNMPEYAAMCPLHQAHFGSMCCSGAAYTGSAACNVCKDFGGADSFTPDLIATYKCFSMDGEEIEGSDDWEGDEAAKVGLAALVL